MAGLFRSPEQALAAEQAARESQALQQGYTPLGASAQELGRNIAGAFGSALGAPMEESPEVSLARTRMNAVKIIDPMRPESYREAAKSLYQSGDIEGASTIISQMPTGKEGFTLGEGQKRFTASGDVIAEVPKGEDQAKAPTTRTIRDGQDFVNQEWNPQARQWVEVGRGQGKGQNISIKNVEDRWKIVHDRYQKELDPITKERAEIEKIKIAINTPGGASPQALQTSIANLFGGKTRAVAELERWGTFGNLPDRVVNSMSRFFEGDYSEQAKADVLRLMRNYEASALNKKHAEVNKRFDKVAKEAEVPNAFYEIDIPQVRMLDFRNMPIEEIAAIDPSALDLDERQALIEALDERGL